MISLGGLLLALLLILLLSEWGAQRIAPLLIQLSSRFQVDTIVVTGNDLILTEDIIEAAGISNGMPMYSLSTVVAANRVRQLPWIRSAAVKRLLPGTVHLAVTEREPAAAIRLEDMCIITEDYLLLPPPKQWSWDLPLLSPPDTNGLAIGKPVENEDVLALLNQALIIRSSHLGLWDDLSELYYSGKTITATLNGAAARLGSQTNELHWLALYNLRKSEPAGTMNADLRIPGKIIVTMNQSSFRETSTG